MLTTLHRQCRNIFVLSLCVIGQYASASEDQLKITFATEPSFDNPGSQLTTANQFLSPDFYSWCTELKEPHQFHRKLWEYCYVAQALKANGVLMPGKKGLGFAVGQEPLPALFAKYGCEVLASDQDFENAVAQGWAKSGQYTISKNTLNSRGICNSQDFKRLVKLDTIDMNYIDSSHYGKYDFVWSCGSLQFLGSIAHGAIFVKNSVKCLRPGGIAIHTTEYNLSSFSDTVTTGWAVIYRRYDIIHLALELLMMGYEVYPINLNSGNDPLDLYVDLPPYILDPHLKLQLGNFVVTSIGLIIRKPLN
jgi:hypothetical protein